jgi:hypothetical protein
MFELIGRVIYFTDDNDQFPIRACAAILFKTGSTGAVMVASPAIRTRQ